MPKRSKKKYTAYQFHLDFNQVNGNIKKLVVGFCRMTQRFNGKAKDPHFVAKAVDTDFDAKGHDNKYDACMNAMDQLFHKLRNGDKVEIITADPTLIEIASGNIPEEGSEARARFNAYAEKSDIRVKHASEHEDPDRMATAQKLATFKVSALQSSSNHAKGYHHS